MASPENQTIASFLLTEDISISLPPTPYLNTLVHINSTLQPDKLFC